MASAAHPKKEIPINLPTVPSGILEKIKIHLVHTSWNEALVQSLGLIIYLLKLPEETHLIAFSRPNQSPIDSSWS